MAPGAYNAVRQLGGVLGVAVLAAVFTHRGGYGSPQLFIDGFAPALWVGAGLSALGVLAALLLPGRQQTPVGVMQPLPALTGEHDTAVAEAERAS